MKKLNFLIIAFAFNFSSAQEKTETPKWDVAKPGETFNYKTQNFTTSEGTWMNLDVMNKVL